MTRNRIRDLREAAGLSVKQLAHAACVPARSLYEYETGTDPTLRRAKRIADALGVPVDALLQEVSS